MLVVLVFYVIFSVFGETVVINDLSSSAARSDSTVTFTQRGEVWPLGHAGHVRVRISQLEPVDNMIFFWFQPCSECSSLPYSEQNLILWLQGGPGGPGTFGATSEIGRFWVNQDPDVAFHLSEEERQNTTIDDLYYFQNRHYTWCRQHHCLFVDQPVKTGFSYQTSGGVPVTASNVNYTKTSPEAMRQILLVLQAFYDVWGEYRNSPFYIGSESYGGIYTPNMAKVIVDYNAEQPTDDDKIPLRGLLIGDPSIDPISQYATYADTLYGMGVVDVVERERIREIMNESIFYSDTNCSLSFGLWNSVFKDDSGGGDGLFQTYTGGSVTENILLGQSPEEIDYFSGWINASEALKLAFHVDQIGSVSHSEGGLVYTSMVESGDSCVSTAHLYADLFVNHTMDIMIFSSTTDPLLGPPTTEAGVEKIIELSNPTIQSLYQSAEKGVWKANSDDSFPAGYHKCINYTHPPDGPSQTFCYVVVRNAGGRVHTTPSYQPRTSYAMFDRFITQQFFDGPGDVRADLPECGGCRPFVGPKVIPKCNVYRPFAENPWPEIEDCGIGASCSVGGKFCCDGNEIVCVPPYIETSVSCEFGCDLPSGQCMQPWQIGAQCPEGTFCLDDKRLIQCSDALLVEDFEDCSGLCLNTTGEGRCENNLIYGLTFGLVMVGVLLAALIIVAVLCCCRLRCSKPKEETKDPAETELEDVGGKE